jgi:hypothetical protein
MVDSIAEARGQSHVTGLLPGSRKHIVLQGAVLLVIILVYPLRHLSYAPSGLVAESYSLGPVPRAVVPAAELVLPVLLFLLCRRLRLRRGRAWLFVPIYALLLVFFLSSLVYSMRKAPDGLELQLFAAFRAHFRWLGPFLVGLLLMDREDVHWLLRLCLGIALVQVPLATLQYTRVAGRNYAGDLVTGLMGANSSGYLMMYQVIAIGFLLTFYLYKQLRLSKLLLLSPVLIAPTVLSDSTFGFILLPVTVGVALGIRRVLLLSRRTFEILVVGAVLLGISVHLYSLAFPRPLPDRFRWEQLRSITIGDFKVAGSDQIQAGRLRIVLMAHESIQSSPASLFVGLGPGAGSSSTVAGRGEFVRRYQGYVEGVGMMAGTVLLELGYLGIAAWVCMVVGIFYFLERARRLMRLRNDPDLPIIAGIRMLFIVLLVCTFYNLSLVSTELMYPAWLLIGWGCSVRIAKTTPQ